MRGWEDWKFPTNGSKPKLITGRQPTADEETPCPVREDQQHCNCWYDGEACCACGDPAMKPEDREDT